MGSHTLKFALASLSLLVVGCQLVGCQPSTKVDSDTPAKVQADESPAAEAVPLDQPVTTGEESSGTYLGAIAKARRNAAATIESLGVTQAIQHYKAINGNYPKSHEEFMKYWKTLQSPLPEIEEGYQLEYRPEDHQIWKVPIEEDEAE